MMAAVFIHFAIIIETIIIKIALGPGHDKEDALIKFYSFSFWIRRVSVPFQQLSNQYLFYTFKSIRRFNIFP